MALKDWKTVRKGKDKYRDYIHFQNMKTDKVIVVARRNKIMDFPKIDFWSVNTGYYQSSISNSERKFKTKSSALKYAKSLMKKH
jgi:hypothetical protein